MYLTDRELFYRHLAIPAEVPQALEIVKAEGIYLYDETGKQYVDLVSGVSVSNVGHQHPAVVEAVKEQAEKYMHLMVYGKYIQSPQVRLAGKMAEHLAPSLDSVYFVNSGSEAIEGALKLAKRITGRTEMVAFKNAYHGHTHGAMSMLGNEKMKYAFYPLLPDIRFLRFNVMDDLAQITTRTACVLIEPVQAEAGILIPDKTYIKALRDRCNETGTILIFDEVQMGFGRTGKLFAYEHFDVVPDILCLAKAMGGGMPIGAFVSSKENMLLLTHHPELGHITTFGGHPVSCAAALASFEVILREKLHEKAQAKGRLFVKWLEGHPLVKTIRQIGLMLAVELKDEETTNKVVHEMYKQGLIIDRFLFHDKAFRIAPPLTITEEEVKMIASKILDSFNHAK
ncbi:aspartate aminotransferase family protein [Candidatus Sulfidibacterium hydrothermale]|uniref:aspartate aminotransferase family protein n=1 Tax=Candidatus Sulfidibacterium hydrothermale TaxID=2875962 RepID=UPI001F0B638A|nr:aspartate aminotransferase family protein [Candidatus Sulfidibacterium hydrothermale]UBM61955.1 aspartate aminotransferase family protein [Candidatus Sulfidibacterium hydrothermale]